MPGSNPYRCIPAPGLFVSTRALPCRTCLVLPLVRCSVFILCVHSRTGTYTSSTYTSFFVYFTTAVNRLPTTFASPISHRGCCRCRVRALQATGPGAARPRALGFIAECAPGCNSNFSNAQKSLLLLLLLLLSAVLGGVGGWVLFFFFVFSFFCSFVKRTYLVLHTAYVQQQYTRYMHHRCVLRTGSCRWHLALLLIH